MCKYWMIYCFSKKCGNLDISDDQGQLIIVNFSVCVTLWTPVPGAVGPVPAEASPCAAALTPAKRKAVDAEISPRKGLKDHVTHHKLTEPRIGSQARARPLACFHVGCLPKNISVCFIFILPFGAFLLAGPRTARRPPSASSCLHDF